MTPTSLTDFDRARMMADDITAGMELITHSHSSSNEPISLNDMRDGEVSFPNITDSVDMYELVRNYRVCLAGAIAIIEDNGRKTEVMDDWFLIPMSLATIKLIDESLKNSNTLTEAKKSVLNRLAEFHQGLMYEEVTLDEFSEATGLPKHLGHAMNIDLYGDQFSIRNDSEAASMTARMMQEIVVNYFAKVHSYEPSEDRASQHPKVQKIMACKAA